MKRYVVICTTASAALMLGGPVAAASAVPADTARTAPASAVARADVDTHRASAQRSSTPRRPRRGSTHAAARPGRRGVRTTPPAWSVPAADTGAREDGGAPISSTGVPGHQVSAASTHSRPRGRRPWEQGAAGAAPVAPGRRVAGSGRPRRRRTGRAPCPRPRTSPWPLGGEQQGQRDRPVRQRPTSAVARCGGVRDAQDGGGQRGGARGSGRRTCAGSSREAGRGTGAPREAPAVSRSARAARGCAATRGTCRSARSGLSPA